jgi:hypothetical protein
MAKQKSDHELKTQPPVAAAVKGYPCPAAGQENKVRLGDVLVLHHMLISCCTDHLHITDSQK